MGTDPLRQYKEFARTTALVQMRQEQMVSDYWHYYA